MVAAELGHLGVHYRFFNQRRFAEAWLQWEVSGGSITGRLALESEEYRLEDVTGVYTRLMDDRILPELDGEPADSPARRRCRSLHDALLRWYDVCSARVVNRSAPQGSNASKPYQAQLILRHGFQVPETLITNQPDLVRDFLRDHDQVIYKSISGVRSVVKLLTDDDLARLDHIRWCPVQFQAFVPGTNVRVHTIAEEAFATEILSGATDYRYAGNSGNTAELRATVLPDQVIDACIELAADLDLPFAGIDIKLAHDGRVICFEVNPSPAFSYYEGNTGQPIAQAVARYLCGG
jgi:glutathione synthase/RimK-type ligase-like ATP-grasp enzyme